MWRRRAGYWLTRTCSCLILFLWVAEVVAGQGRGAAAQELAAERAFKPIVEKDGLSVKYVLYEKADGARNGVVIFLRNTNDFAISYRFSAVFRSEDAEETGFAEGQLGPCEARTGDRDGLFWIPFDDDTPIVEIGIRGLVVESTE